VTKYRNSRTESAHGTFDSRGEARRYEELRLLVMAGEINSLERQVTVPLEGRDGPIKYASGRRARIVVDFRYEEDGRVVLEDFKGKQTQTSKLQHAIARAMGIEIRITTRET
jgi:hypothetical protein